MWAICGICLLAVFISSISTLLFCFVFVDSSVTFEAYMWNEDMWPEIPILLPFSFSLKSHLPWLGMREIREEKKERRGGSNEKRIRSVEDLQGKLWMFKLQTTANFVITWDQWGLQVFSLCFPTSWLSSAFRVFRAFFNSCWSTLCPLKAKACSRASAEFVLLLFCSKIIVM